MGLGLSVEVMADPAISIIKLTNGYKVDTPPGPSLPVGSLVLWTYLVANSGTVVLGNVTVTDNQGVTVSCPISTLAPGVKMPCSGSGTVVAGQYSNVGTASGTPPAGPPVSASDQSYYYGTGPGITIEKRTNGEDADTPPGPTISVGHQVVWTYEVSNNGDVGLVSVTVSDDKGVVITCPQTTLVPGESMTCTGSGTAVAGQYSNIGTASGTPPAGPPVSASDPSHYNGIAPPTPVPAVGPAALWVMAGLLGGMGILLGFRQRR